jgi:hypothetical protein
MAFVLAAPIVLPRLAPRCPADLEQVQWLSPAQKELLEVQN